MKALLITMAIAFLLSLISVAHGELAGADASVGRITGDPPTRPVLPAPSPGRRTTREPG